MAALSGCLVVVVVIVGAYLARHAVRARPLHVWVVLTEFLNALGGNDERLHVDMKVGRERAGRCAHLPSYFCARAAVRRESKSHAAYPRTSDS